MANENNNALMALMEAGADAMDNMYDIDLEFGNFNATVRAGGVDIPAVNPKKYQDKYKGVAYDRVQSSQDFTRNLKVTFRMDAKYQLYDIMTSLHAWHVNPNTGGVANANALVAGTVTVRTLAVPFLAAETSSAGQIAPEIIGVDSYESGEGKVGAIKPVDGKTKEWKFMDAWVSNVGQPKYSTESDGTAIKFDVEFTFGRCKYPGFEASLGDSTSARQEVNTGM